MANFGSYLALASYSRHRSNHEENKQKSAEKKSTSKKSAESKTDDSVKFAAMLQMFFSMGLTLYTWSVTSDPSHKFIVD